MVPATPVAAAKDLQEKEILVVLFVHKLGILLWTFWDLFCWNQPDISSDNLGK
jgi:hypothetical protein